MVVNRYNERIQLLKNDSSGCRSPEEIDQAILEYESKIRRVEKMKPQPFDEFVEDFIPKRDDYYISELEIDKEGPQC